MCARGNGESVQVWVYAVSIVYWCKWYVTSVCNNTETYSGIPRHMYTVRLYTQFSSVYSKGQRQIVQTGYGHQIPCSEMVGLLASVNYTIIYNYTGVKWLAFSGQIFMGFVYLQFFEKQPWMKLLKAYIIHVHVYKSIGKTSKMKVQRLCQLWEEIKTWVINYLRVARNLIMYMFWISIQTSLKQS